MTINAEAISKPTKKLIQIECPNCKLTLNRYVPLNAKKGKEECGACGTKLQWREE